MPDQLRIRQAVRAVVMDSDDRILLVRFEWPDGRTVWAAPGGGIDTPESTEQALRRELAEEVGLADPVIGPLIWTRLHRFSFIDGSHDGQAERYHLIRTEPFEPAPAWSWQELRGEYITAMRWWTLDELARSTEAFAPRRLPDLVRRLIDDGPPQEPFDAGV